VGVGGGCGEQGGERGRDSCGKWDESGAYCTARAKGEHL